jgi:tetratricopeptide (TPR) repeat protein
MVSGGRVLGLALLSLVVGGCASIQSLVESTPRSAPVVNANVPSADQLAAPHRAQAAQLERDGRLRQAVEAWTTALAFEPNHEPSRQGLKRLRERIDRELAEHLRSGWRALANDGAAEARRHFLAALALDPDSRPAQEALRTVPAPPSAPVAVEAKPAAVVARPAVTLTHGPEAKPAAASVVVRPAAPVTSEPRRRSPEETEKPDVLYATAKAHLVAHRDDEAYRALAQLARVSPGYKDSAALLHELRPRLVQQRYQEGMSLFRDELIEQAIEKWRGVLELEPTHANARRNIEQAERMLHTLAAQPKR